jgi:hypothetical protein
MTWYFCYYVSAKYGQAYPNPADYMNMTAIIESCPSAIVHASGATRIHAIGNYLKMYGLGSSIIVETSDPNEATILRLLEQSVIDETVFPALKCPKLQLIVSTEGLTTLDPICAELDEARFNQQCSREETETNVRKVQRIANHLTRLIDEIEEKASVAFKKETVDYANRCIVEIERYTDLHRHVTKTTTLLRKQLMRGFIPMISFKNKDSGFE